MQIDATGSYNGQGHVFSTSIIFGFQSSAIWPGLGLD